MDMSLWATEVTMSGVASPTLLVNTAPVWVGICAMLLFRERLGIVFWPGRKRAKAWMHSLFSGSRPLLQYVSWV